LALEVAQESMVLLKNDANILPLSPQTKLAVIGPLASNRADLLQLALQSLQFQTLSAESFEVLVIDNGSTDNTKQVVATFPGT